MAKGFDEKEVMNVVDAMEVDVDPMAGTAEDQYDMTRIGKKQELLVRLFLSMPGIITAEDCSVISNICLCWRLRR